MSQNAGNPYSSPLNYAGPSTIAEEGDVLASRLVRLGAAIIDSLIIMIVFLPIAFALGIIQRLSTGEAGLVDQIVNSLLGMTVMLVLNGYLLANRGQTIGKLLLKIQIADYTNGGLLPFVRVFVYRYLWLYPLVFICALIPGNVDSMLINILTLIDALMIFGSEQRCLHDLIAGSKVVLYRPDRARAS